MSTVKRFFYLMLLICLVSLAISCDKQNGVPHNYDTSVHKTIMFSLYTDIDFSGENDAIAFTVFITNLRDQMVWDSALVPMKLKDIPDMANKIIVEKAITIHKDSVLKVGFKYVIDEVGYSSFYDTCNASETLKKVNFNFQ
jgi:hypothetical protein